VSDKNRAMIRKHKRDWTRGLSKRIGPEESWTRRMVWRINHGKARAFRQLVGVLEAKGLRVVR
jgi:hypothetical protein